jgi:protoporphyrinogen/coproporphyrinogen III oxidase
VPKLRAVVVGGGVAGLAAAVRIARDRPDAEVLVLEAASAVGGKLRRIQLAGSWVDVGAEAMLARRPEGVQAVRELGLAGELIEPLTTSALLRNRGTNRPLPARTVLGVPADPDALRAAGVLSEQTLARIEAEPAAGPYPPLAEDLSVAELVGQRFGDEVVQRLVDPLLGGVYAGRAEAISVRAALPALASRLTTEGGSLLAAARSTLPAPDAGPAGPVFASLTGGLARLPEAMAAQDRVTVRTASTVRAISRRPTGFLLTVGPTSAPELVPADLLVLAVPAGKASILLAELAPIAAHELAGIETASVAIVTLAFDRLPAGALPAGSGLLIPVVEGLACKAMTFSSQKWPGVGAESAITLMRASLGRAGEEWVLQREDGELVAMVRAELAQLTGLTAQPVDVHVQRWGGGLPQYAVGHLDRVARIRAAVAAVPGLAVCGASYDGVGIPACIGSAHAAADRVLSTLREPAQ